MRRLRLSLAVSLVVLLVAIVYVYAAFTQSFPSVTTPAGSVTFTTTCPTLIVDSPVSPVAGSIRFNCGPAGVSSVAAFTVPSPGGSDTSTFTLPAGYTGLTAVAHTTGACTAGVAITSGTSAVLSAGTYDYCAGYAGQPSTGGSLAGFSIAWA